MDCLFCKIVNGDLETEKVYENEEVLAFKDLNPQAPHHMLIIPKTHISTVNDAQPEHQNNLGALFLAAKSIAADLGLSDDGYRLVVNCNGHGGQTVFHIHMHFIAGRPCSWPPG